ncbi:MAG: hypothetical protein RJA59_68 [Pseudomonadota bacterium]
MLLPLAAALLLAGTDTPPEPPPKGPAPQAHAAAALGGASLEELAKQLQNPLADLVSVPFQNNFNGGGAAGLSASYNLNFQPVIPIELDRSWNLIVRPIVPYYSLVVPGGERVTGLGEIILETFFSPSKASSFIWGIGPAFSFPTATNEAVATGCFAVGPVVAAVYMEGPWVIGALLTQLNAFARMGSAHLDTTSLQVFLNYNLPNAWSIGTAPTFTVNWNQIGQQWTVPVGASISKTLSIAKQPISLSLAYYANVVHPEGGSPWLLRMVVTFMFPK